MYLGLPLPQLYQTGKVRRYPLTLAAYRITDHTILSNIDTLLI